MRHTLGEAIERYIRSILPTKSAGTASGQTQQLGWWNEQIGYLRLSDVTPSVIAEYRDKLSADRSPATVVAYMAALSVVLQTCYREWEWLEESPISRVRRPTVANARVRFLSDEERSRLLDACKVSPHPYLHTVVTLALSTGARKGELLGLEWPDVDLGKQTLTFYRTKNKEIRKVPIVGLALDLMREHSRVRRLDTALVFPGNDGQRPAWIHKAWCQALEVAGIEDFRFHDLRHSAASYLAMSGASIAEIAAILGHGSYEMVKRYSHLSDSHLTSIVGRMNQQIFG